MSTREWFKGLKYAEEIGAPEAYEELMRNAFEDDKSGFEQGVADYIDYVGHVLLGGE